MKSFLSYVIVLILSGVVACISAKTANQENAEEEIRRLSDEEVQAFLRKDAEAMARLWSNDLVVTNPLNKFVNKQGVLGMVRSGFLVITSYERRIEYARVYGDTVILAGSETVVWGGKMPMAGKSEQLRFTAIWMKQQDRWQEVARHANVVPSDQQSQRTNTRLEFGPTRGLSKHTSSPRQS
jgi:uncharacterized protein (TIGR02246 family)